MMGIKNGKIIGDAEEIIERFGGIRPMASKINVPVTTVQGWKKRNAIPANRVTMIVEAAGTNNIDLSDLIGDGGSAGGRAAASAAGRETPSDRSVANENKTRHKQGKTGADENDDDNIVIESISLAPGAKAKTPPDKGFSQLSAPTRTGKEKEKEMKKTKETEKVLKRSASDSNFDEFSPHDALMRQIRESENKAVRNSIWGSTVLIAIVIVSGAFLFWPEAQSVRQQGAELNALQQNVAVLEDNVQMLDQDVRDLDMRSGFAKGFQPADLEARFAQIQSQADKVQETVEKIGMRAEEVTGAALSGTALSLSGTPSGAEGETAGSGKLPGQLPGRLADRLSDRLAALEKTLEGQAQLRAAVGELRDLSAALEGRIGGVEQMLQQKAAPGQDGASALGQTLAGVDNNDLKAAAMLIAFAQLRDSLNRQAPFEQDLALLQKLAGPENTGLQESLMQLSPHANGGALTAQGLSEELRGLAGEIVVASLKGEDISLTDKAKVRFAKLFRLEKDGALVGGTDTQALVTRAQFQLDQGDIEGALTTLRALEGPAAQTAAPLIDKAQISLMVQQGQTLLRQMIVRQIGGGGLTAASGPVYLDPETGAAQSQYGLSRLLPQRQIVRDEKSGTAILENEPRFKGFSTGPAPLQPQQQAQPQQQVQPKNQPGQ